MTEECDLYLAACARVLHTEPHFTIRVWTPENRKHRRVSWKAQRVRLYHHLRAVKPGEYWHITHRVSGFCLMAVKQLDIITSAEFRMKYVDPAAIKLAEAIEAACLKAVYDQGV